MIPPSSRFVVVGAGMHGLSTAYHLAVELRQRGLGSGADVVVIEKATPGAGATGIACGVVRNNYFQPAMSELMQACVEVWESDPEAYHYNGVGYIALGPSVQEGDLTAVYERHQRIGYRSDLYLGEAEVDAHMKGLFPDWRAKGVTVCLHEHQGGFAFNVESVIGLRDKCLAEGVQIHSYTEVTGFELGDDDSVTAVETDKGRIAVGEQVVIAPGPWAKRFWGMLGLPMTIDVHTPSGDVARDQPMWTYWNLQEGEITVDPLMFATADGSAPPVIHLDTDAPLYSDDGAADHATSCGASTTSATGTACRAARPRSRSTATSSSTPIRPPRTSTTSFPDMWCAALSHAMSRFEGCRALYKRARSGGVGSFTADNFPVFDYLKPNVYGILDSNHGYKMIGVGREVARVLCGDSAPLLTPFRFERFATGDLHPVSNSPYPWS